jgi:hypothetical protein
MARDSFVRNFGISWIYCIFVTCVSFNEGINSNKHSTPGEANSHTAAHQTCFLWNPQIYYQVQRSFHWLLSLVRLIQFTPSPHIPIGSILISSYLYLGPPSDLFSFSLLIKIMYAFPMLAICPAHFTVLNLIISYIWLRIQIMKLLSLLPFLSLNILYILFLSILRLHPVPNESQVSQPYKTYSTSSVFFNHVFSWEMGRQKILNWVVASTP